MLNSQVMDALKEQALDWIDHYFPECQAEEIPIYQEVYVNKILTKLIDQL
jgi:hypothetical protein